MFKKQVKETEIAGDNLRRMVRVVTLLQTFAENKGGFSFFSQEGWKNCRWGASHMQYAILDASGEA